MIGSHYEKSADKEHGYTDEALFLCMHRVLRAETDGCDDPAIPIMEVGNMQEQFQRLLGRSRR